MNSTLYLIVALIASVGANLYQWRDCAVDAAKTEGKQTTAVAEATTVATQTARDVEGEAQARAEAIADAYEKGKQDAEESARRIVDDLRAQRRELRELWNTCAAAERVPATGDSAGEPDAAARRREESAGRIVLAAMDCENQVTALQNFIRSERAPRGTEAKP